MSPLWGAAAVEYWILPRLRRIRREQVGKQAPRDRRADVIARYLFFPYTRLWGRDLAGSREPKAMTDCANSNCTLVMQMAIIEVAAGILKLPHLVWQLAH